MFLNTSLKWQNSPFISICVCAYVGVCVCVCLLLYSKRLNGKTLTSVRDNDDDDAIDDGQLVIKALGKHLVCDQSLTASPAPSQAHHPLSMTAK